MVPYRRHRCNSRSAISIRNAACQYSNRILFIFGRDEIFPFAVFILQKTFIHIFFWIINNPKWHKQRSAAHWKKRRTPHRTPAPYRQRIMSLVTCLLYIQIKTIFLVSIERSSRGPLLTRGNLGWSCWWFDGMCLVCQARWFCLWKAYRAHSICISRHKNAMYVARMNLVRIPIVNIRSRRYICNVKHRNIITNSAQS